MNYLKTLQSIADYYANLLIVQYHDKPKAKVTIKLLAQLLWVNMIFLQIRDAFDWKTATGTQLDIIGQWVGVNRFYDGQLFNYRPWFALLDWNEQPDNLQGGFSTFDTFNTLNGGFLDYEYIQPTQNALNDKAFRIMIGLKIIKNNINTTCKNIDNAIWDYFEGKVYTVWSPNELTYYYPAELSEIMQVALSKNVLPKPTGINIQLMEIIENA